VVQLSVARTTTPVTPCPDRDPEQLVIGRELLTAPSAVTRVIARTWLPKLPTTWWALPWMSAPMALPTVT
jgi:hypothetical protein